MTIPYLAQRAEAAQIQLRLAMVAPDLQAAKDHAARAFAALGSDVSARVAALAAPPCDHCVYEVRLMALAKEAQMRADALNRQNQDFADILQECIEWMNANPPCTAYGTLDHRADDYRAELVKQARAILNGETK